MPVLCLTGVGLTAAVALRTVRELAAHFRVITAPVAEAANPATPHRLAEVTVEGAVGLLDEIGVEQAHIVGLSFGAAIAQEIAIRHPARVRSLVLGSSSAGGRLCVPPEAPIAAFLGRLDEMPVEEGLWAAVPYLYAAMTRRDRAPRIGQDIARRLSNPLDPRSFRRQHAAARAHDAGARLARITAPTLVIHGEQDRIVPLENGRRLADGIRGGHLITLPGGAHAFPTDVPNSNRELVKFLLGHSRPSRGSTAGRSARADRV